MSKIGIVGASGYAGAELLRLLASHDQLDVAWAAGDTQAGKAISELYPSLAAVYGDLRYLDFDPADAAGLDAVFCCLPHGASQAVMADLIGRVGLVVDLGADFRLDDPAVYEQWYGAAHEVPALLSEFTYGIPELWRQAVADASAVAVPGCYPTAAALALTPLVRAGLIETSGVIVDAASGVSGAGRGPKDNTTFCAVDEDFNVYGLLTHRHTPEIEQATRCQVLFTPHLAPMSRGILATCYARPSGSATTADVLATLRGAYEGEPFIVVTDGEPSTKATLGSNSCHLTARVDERTGWLVVVSAIDNLVKGASGQAIQCANLALGFDETAGLPVVGFAP